MDKLQEIISDLSLWHLASKEELKPLDINAGPCYIIEQSYVKDIMIGYMRKQQAIIEEHQRQQEVAVNQFRQAQEDIKLLQAENKRYRNALEFYANETTYTNEFEDCPPAVELDGGQTARKALEGDAE
ncbi:MULTISPECIES: hypothetical protein [Bacillus amyloliquefaciens group]|uniref:hypothetical protein n=1 Tax=Bacillus amyloliquefaciens group TaxID=1938374 RepID=UPI000BA62F15|nr:hypothetical protein [Bacillus velezensis]PAE75137.1 hypothetical protein CHH82_16420 [Bacillus velezensis]